MLDMCRLWTRWTLGEEQSKLISRIGYAIVWFDLNRFIQEAEIEWSHLCQNYLLRAHPVVLDFSNQALIETEWSGWSTLRCLIVIVGAIVRVVVEGSAVGWMRNYKV